jgi:hypothetical protein
MITMSLIWNNIENLAQKIEQQFRISGTQISGHESKYNWYNAIYASDRYRRAHIEIVDNRNTHKIYILHCTIFPHFNDPSPIWGFDAVCGPNKITGAFHDFSSGGDKTHFMMNWFRAQSESVKWKKERNLPEWAQMIFSPAMIAAGNISDEAELDSLCNIGLHSLDYYLKNVGLTQESGADYHMAQNRYCYYQKQNPHVINSMVSMGVDNQVMTNFVSEVLFPETS